MSNFLDDLMIEIADNIDFDRILEEMQPGDTDFKSYVDYYNNDGMIFITYGKYYAPDNLPIHKSSRSVNNMVTYIYDGPVTFMDTGRFVDQYTKEEMDYILKLTDKLKEIDVSEYKKYLKKDK